MNTFSLWLLLRERSAGRSDPHRLTGILAIIAFAVTTAVTLIVLGGYQAFAERAVGASGDEASYPLLAGIASALLLVPLSTLGASAGRLAMARRDDRLAALRLAGATRQQVSLLTLLETCTQALFGALAGVAGYFALIPVIQLVVFQGRPFTFAELLLPWWALPLAVICVIAIAVVSAGTSLRRVSIGPLGVAARHNPPALHWSRLIPFAIALGVFIAAFKTNAGFTTLMIFLIGGFLLLNLIGPFFIQLIGHLWVRWARTASSLIGARRLLDNPKGAWRSISGIALAAFVAGMASLTGMFADGQDPADQYFTDVGTGGILALVIAAVVAAVSTGVMQAGRVIDQRGQYRALDLAGMDMSHMNRARMLETFIPLLVAVGLSVTATMLFVAPILTFAVFGIPAVLIKYIVSILGAIALVIVGVIPSARVLKNVLV